MASEINPKEIILVTGASGYIASHIIKQLLETGHRVRGTVRNLKDPKKINPLIKLVENPKYELELCEADLLKPETWASAIKDCSYVIHTASPVPINLPRDENMLIKPALDGTLNVLSACADPRSIVKRVVLTSSIAAVAGDCSDDSKIYTEEDWTEPIGASAYIKSKTLAEKAAWDFVKSKGPTCFELAVINPGLVVGPVLHDTICASMEPIRLLMLRKIPRIPNISIPACDVRDVARAHIVALTCPEAVGKRHIIVHSSMEPESMQQYALWLHAEFKSKGYNVPVKLLPNIIFKLFAIFNATAASGVKTLGKKAKFDNSRLLDVLNVEPIDLHTSIIDMANSMIGRKLI